MDIAVKRFFISLVFPGLFVLLIWMVFIAEQTLDLDFFYYGLFPRRLNGLLGILLSPLIHGDIKHLVANTFPLLILTTGLFYFYRDLAFKVFFLSYLMTGLLVWLAARPAYHIGASGIIYGLAGFLTVSGLIRKHLGLIALSLIVVFQYGSMIVGVFPIEERISWESHLLGLSSGIALAFVYRKVGPQGESLFWHSLPDDTEDEEDVGEGGEQLPWDEYDVEGKRKPSIPPKPKGDSGVNYPDDWESDWTI